MDNLITLNLPSPLLVTVWCKHCGECWAVSSEMDTDIQIEIAALFRSGNLIAGVRRLQNLGDISLKDAKCIYYHVTQQKGRCHHCSAKLNGERFALCEHCGCLNYDW